MCTIAWAGPFRLGKSFLLNYFVRYLEGKVDMEVTQSPVGVLSRSLYSPLRVHTAGRLDRPNV